MTQPKAESFTASNIMIGFMKYFYLLIFFALVACAPAQPSVQLVDARGLTGTYSGTYTCGQGLTGLDLDVRGFESGRVEAVFNFFPVSQNPNVPSGSFKMAGGYFSNNRLRLEARETDWIRQPNGYIVVNLDGFLSQNATIFSGTVPQCSNSFSVRKKQ